MKLSLRHLRRILWSLLAALAIMFGLCALAVA